MEIKPNINDLIPGMAGDPVVMDSPGYPHPIVGNNHHEDAAVHQAASRFGVDHGVDHGGVEQHGGGHGGGGGIDRMDRIERERMNRLDQVVDRLNRVDRGSIDHQQPPRGSNLEQHIDHRDDQHHLEHNRLDQQRDHRDDRMDHDHDRMDDHEDDDHNVEPQPSSYNYPPSHSEEDDTPPNQNSPPRAVPQGVLMPHQMSPPPRVVSHLPSSVSGSGGGPQGAMLSPPNNSHHSNNSHATYTSTPNIVTTTDSLPSANAYEQQPLN